MNNKKLTWLTQCALLMAIELVMKLTGLGSVPVGPLYMSFLTLPIAIGAMITGPAAGAFLGLVFGAVSFKDALTGGSIMTSTLRAVDPVHTFILCVVTRVLMGWLTALVFKAAKSVDKNRRFCYFAGALAAPLLNTLLFMGYLCLAFYNSDYVQGLVSGLGATNPVTFVVLLVGIQGLLEALVCGIAGGFIAKAVAKYLKQ